MKTVLFSFALATLTTISGFQAQAARPVLQALNCVGANGVVFELKRPGAEAIIKTRYGLMTVDYAATVDLSSDRPQLKFTNAALLYTIPTTLDLKSKMEQSFVGVLTQRMNLTGIPRPVTPMQCRVTLR